MAAMMHRGFVQSWKRDFLRLVVLVTLSLIVIQNSASAAVFVSASGWNDKGNALYDLGRYEEAITCYDRAIEINPNYAYAWNNKGIALWNLGRYEEAITCYDRAIEINPNYAYAWYIKGNTLRNLGRYEEAITCYDRVIEIDPNHAYAWYNKGTALRNLGRYEEAITCYDRVIEIDPNDADAWFIKGVLLIILGKPLEALGALWQAAGLDPSFTLYFILLIIAFILFCLAFILSCLKNAPRLHTILSKFIVYCSDWASASKLSPAVTIERTIYDPLDQDFKISSPRPLVNVRDWISHHDPSSYWLVICVHNHGSRAIDEWGIELESSSALQVLEAAIEGSNGQVRIQTSNPKPWRIKSVLGIPPQHGIVIPRGGSRRVYFRLGSESCGISHSINGQFTTSDIEMEIREKEFQHSCDVATLGVAMQQNPETAMKYAENALKQRYRLEVAQNYLHTFRLIQEINTCCHEKRFEDVHEKLHILEDALGKIGVSDKLAGLVRQLNKLDIDDGMGGSMLEIKARRAEKMCKNIIDVWIVEVLPTP